MNRPARRSAEERLRRLLVMLPWLMERGETTLFPYTTLFRYRKSVV